MYYSGKTDRQKVLSSIHTSNNMAAIQELLQIGPSKKRFKNCVLYSRRLHNSPDDLWMYVDIITAKPFLSHS